MALRPVRERPSLPLLTGLQAVVGWSSSLLSALSSLFQEFGWTINRLIAATKGLGDQDFDSKATTTNVTAAESWKDLGVSVTVDVPAGRNVELVLHVSWAPIGLTEDRVVSFRIPQLNDEFSEGDGLAASFIAWQSFGAITRQTIVAFDNAPATGSKTYTVDGIITGDEFQMQFISLRAVIVS